VPEISSTRIPAPFVFASGARMGQTRSCDLHFSVSSVGFIVFVIWGGFIALFLGIVFVPHAQMLGNMILEELFVELR
jgi:hypothetical protein